jgi:hypothetical protein
MEVRQHETKLVRISQIKELPFNREIKQKHVKALMKSISNRGILRQPVLVKTKVVSGKRELYSLDGQHFIAALSEMDKKTVSAYVIETESMNEIVETMAVLNNVQQKWTMIDYVNCYCGLKLPDYIELKKHSIKNKLSINVSSVILSGINTAAWGKGLNFIKNGTFKALADDKDTLTKNLLQVMGVLNTNSTKFAIAYITFYRSLGAAYNHQRLLKSIEKKMKGDKSIPHDVNFIYGLLSEIY